MMLSRKSRRVTPEGTRAQRIRKRIRSDNGSEPLRRMVVLAAFFALLSCLIGILSSAQIILTLPPTITDPVEIIKWIFTSIVAPHAILYLSGLLAAFYVLPQQNLRYVRFIFTQGARYEVTAFVITESILVAIIGLLMSQAGDSAYTTVSFGMSGVQSSLWNIAVFSLLAPTWVGFRTGWKVYRLYGAQTMQQRYEEHLRDMEIKVSGQAWDKRIVRPLKRVFARDGSRARGLLAWAILSPTVFSFAWMGSLYLNSSYALGVGVFASMTILISIFAAVSKYRDGTYQRIPALIAIRFPDTVDTYDPASTGVRVFDRS